MKMWLVVYIKWWQRSIIPVILFEGQHLQPLEYLLVILSLSTNMDVYQVSLSYFWLLIPLRKNNSTAYCSTIKLQESFIYLDLVSWEYKVFITNLVSNLLFKLNVRVSKTFWHSGVILTGLLNKRKILWTFFGKIKHKNREGKNFK